MVRREAESLIGAGMHEAALDLLFRSYLPLSGSSTVWVWRGDLFIYYDSVLTLQFHSVVFPELADVLRSLGFSPGTVVHHVKGYDATLKVSERIFPSTGLSCLKSLYVYHKVKGHAFASRLTGQVRIDWVKKEIVVTDDSGLRLFSDTFNYDEEISRRAWPRRKGDVGSWPLTQEPPFNEAQATAILLQCLLREPLWRGLCDMPGVNVSGPG
ncbi:MAG: hypothetical protein ACP5FT_02655 [Acidilobus sp.]